MTTVRVEFLTIQQSNSELFAGADNVIKKRAAPSVETVITGTALADSSLISIPKCDLVRVISEGGNAYVEWGGTGVVASSGASMKFYDGQPDTFAPGTATYISAMTAA